VIEAKTAFIIKHFGKKFRELKKNNFEPKAMLVTEGRPSVIKYKRAFDTALAKLPESKVQSGFELSFTSYIEI
jgi:hypothetical protein